MGAHKYETPLANQSQQLLYLLDKEIIHFWEVDKTKGFGFGVVN